MSDKKGRFLRRLEERAVRRAVAKLQRKRPAEIFPGANPSGRKCYDGCGHENQTRGAQWKHPDTSVLHTGRCLGCKVCEKVKVEHTKLW